jgi:hypothetical protein
MTPEDRAAHWDAVSGRLTQRRHTALNVVTIIGIVVPMAFLALAVAVMMFDGIWGPVP